ncbi:hypothetical protein NSE01_12390 [Novosphingobium sediminis]|uniref:PqqD family protein n=1 Tax=Novosphingobium sediminis TaxID=707214 RepID=A0A512AI98_9SPHN|nr:PqqD family protein [Novosphingobium sediminis]GEN99406.1 hypothetical protein NSE01_12390 [Novosphingobium sediminis]
MRFALNHGDVCSEEIDGEVIIINLVTGCYYSLGGSAAAVWPLILAGYSAAEIAAHFMPVASDPASVEAQVTAFLDYLCAEGIVLVSDDVVRHDVSEIAAADGFSAPVAEKFTDMQELLLVDPIHEVAEAGWPLRDTQGS